MANRTLGDESLPKFSKLARQNLKELFSESCETQWCTVMPKDKDGLDCIPSDLNKYYSKSRECKENVKGYLGKSFEMIFNDRGHVDWEDFTLNVYHKLGLTYRKVFLQ